MHSVFEEAGAKVVVDEGSLALLTGAVVDFEDDMLKSAPQRLLQHPVPAPKRHSRAPGLLCPLPRPPRPGCPGSPAPRALPPRPAPALCPPQPSLSIAKRAK